MSMIGAILLLAQLNGDVYFKVGPDARQTGITRQYVSAGYINDLSSSVDFQFEVGGWSAIDNNNPSSFYTSYQVGKRTKGPLNIGAFTGVALLSSPGNAMSSVYQFKHDIGIGYTTKEKMGIGIDYSHLSNAGLIKPNTGLDFVQLRIQFPFN